MLVNTPYNIVRAFSEGRIGWRDACRRLDLERFEELDALRISFKLPLYQPPVGNKPDYPDDCDALLYGDIAE